MKNEPSIREQKILDDAFAMLEGCVNNLAKNECLSLDNIHKAIHYTYEVVSSGMSPIIIGESYENKSKFIEFVQSILQNEQPVTSWPDAEEEVLEGGDKE